MRNEIGKDKCKIKFTAEIQSLTFGSLQWDYFKMNCCNSKNNITVNCYNCGSKTQSVKYKTVLMMLKYKKIKEAEDDKYFFCSKPECSIVYFTSNYNSVFYKNDLRNKVVIKKNGETKLVCYCFDISEKDIKDEIKLTGKSTIPYFISEKIKDKLCACDIKNPSGKCCLGYVKRIIKIETV